MVGIHKTVPVNPKEENIDSLHASSDDSTFICRGGGKAINRMVLSSD
jgi:hypothetical protein